ncbi:MAG: magnesium-translocating P-type ATPase [Sarcina sp.]
MIKELKEKRLNKIREIKEENKKRIEYNLLQYAVEEGHKVVENLSSNITGLTKEKVKFRQEDGLNEITEANKKTILKKLIEAFVNPFTLVLVFLSVISFITDFVLAEKGDKDLTTVLIVLTMVFISGLLKLIQEGRSNKAGDKLKNLIKTTATVVRETEESEVEIKDLVVGDIVKLSAGDMIPADLRILEAKDLFISESAMTGESEPVEKLSEVIKTGSLNPLEHKTLAFMGTNVISGYGVAVVIAIGDDTLFGTVAKSITEEKEATSFDKGVNSVSLLLIRFMAVMVPIVFFINGFTKGNWMDAFLFAISIAVGLTPEMLPMIVTTNLAKGALRMSKQKTIVKKLNSIQNFGAMDVLCTDKTGTLTEDKIVLEKYLDIAGKEEIRVLRHGYLVSAFQTGLRNLLDRAILDHGCKDGLKDLENNYIKVDEIPFDFSRRRMSVVLKDKNHKMQLITKGAVEEMLEISSFAEYEGTVVSLTEVIKKRILKTVKELNNQGMRVIAVAQKNDLNSFENFSVKDEKDMVLIGYIAFLDPAKKTAKDSIKILNEYGVSVKVLTGDNDKVTSYVCSKVGIESKRILLGEEIEVMSREQLKKEVEEVNIFAKLSPSQKEKVVEVLKENGHVVGFMGDGINDAAAMRKADVSISVDTAVDIAKESADIILLEKDLTVLGKAVIEGRKTFANIIKYIKMTASSNFGNMFSVLIASAFLPFLPMLASQILILNLIYDISCIAIPWDNVDEEFLKEPRSWNANSIGTFMKFIGPVSSIFDIATYLVMFFVICPAVAGGGYNDPTVNKELFAIVFNTGWFIESLWSQTLVIHMIRTEKIPFIKSRASKLVTISTTIAIIVGTALPFTAVGKVLSMTILPFNYFIWLIVIIVCYMVLITVVKKVYIKKYGELL